MNSAIAKPLSTNPVLPYPSHFATIDGYQVHYLDEGEGPVVIMLHGNPTWSFYFRNLVGALKDKFRVIVPDYIGCGLSDHPTDAHFRAVDRMDQTEKLIDQLGIKKFSLVLHDWGGPIGTGVAVRRLDAVERIVYLNTTLTEIDSLPKIIKTAAKPIIGKFITKRTKRFLKLTTEFGVAKKLQKDVKAGYLHPYKTSDRRTAIWDFVADIPFENTHPTYAELLTLSQKLPLLKDKPVQIIWGLQDPCFHKEMLGKVAQHFPHASVLEIPDASHLVLEDAPELAASTIREFLLNPSPRTWTTELASQDAFVEDSSALYSAYYRYASKHPDQEMFVEGKFKRDSAGYSHTKYQDFQQLVNKFQRGLDNLGLVRNDRVLFLVPANIEFLALALAVMGRGGIPIFVDPGVGKDNLKKVLNQCDPAAVISIPKGHLLKFLARDVFKKLKFHLTVSDWIFWGKSSASFLKKYSAAPLPPVKSPGVSFIAFTSGATGTPKGVMFTDEVIKGQLKVLQDQLGVTAGGRDLPLLPIFSLFNVALGLSTVLPPLDASKPLAFEPSYVVRAIHDLNISSSFGSPTLWNKIADYCVLVGKTLPSITKVFIAGAPVPDALLEKLRPLIPNGEVFTPYGATEALPVSLISASQRIDHNPRSPAQTGEVGVNVGKAVAGCQIKIIRASNTPLTSISSMEELPPCTIGEIIVRGAHVSPSYLSAHLGADAANKNGKILDSDAVWHRMGDVGYLSADGDLYFCGRKAHIVSVGSKSHYSVPIEQIFNMHEKVKRSALIALGNGKEAAIAIEPLPQYFPDTDDAKNRFIAELKEIGKANPISQGVSKFFFHPSFPVDARHNAKIFRDKLGAWASNNPQ